MERVLSLQMLSELNNNPGEMLSTYSWNCSDGSAACSTVSNNCGGQGTKEW